MKLPKGLTPLTLSLALLVGCSGSSETQEPLDANGDSDVLDEQEPADDEQEALPLEPGEPLTVTQTRRETARSEFAALNKAQLEIDFSPDDLYATFNEFALTHFGMANEPLIERYTGER